MQSDVGDQGLVAVADDSVDFGEGGEFLGSTLGVATRNDDASIWILAAHAADESAGLAVGLRSYAAGIYNNDMGSGRLPGGLETAPAQIGGDGLSVGAAGAAAEVFNVIFCHIA